MSTPPQKPPLLVRHSSTRIGAHPTLKQFSFSQTPSSISHLPLRFSSSSLLSLQSFGSSHQRRSFSLLPFFPPPFPVRRGGEQGPRFASFYVPKTIKLPSLSSHRSRYPVRSHRTPSSSQLYLPCHPLALYFRWVSRTPSKFRSGG